jgi:hypothetical protein
MLSIYRLAHGIAVIGDGSDISNTKIVRAYAALNTMEQKQDAPLTGRMSLIYNKFSNKSSKALGDMGLRNLGGAPRYEHASTEQVMNQLSMLDAFDKII